MPPKEKRTGQGMVAGWRVGRLTGMAVLETDQEHGSKIDNGAAAEDSVEIFDCWYRQ